jgi:hypothetical protein
MKFLQEIGGGDALCLSRAVLQNHKGGFAQYSETEDPPAKCYFLLDEFSKGLNKDALVRGTMHGKNLHRRRISAGAAIAAVPSSFRREPALDLRYFVTNVSRY